MSRMGENWLTKLFFRADDRSARKKKFGGPTFFQSRDLASQKFSRNLAIAWIQITARGKGKKVDPALALQ